MLFAELNDVGTHGTEIMTWHRREETGATERREGGRERKGGWGGWKGKGWGNVANNAKAFSSSQKKTNSLMFNLEVEMASKPIVKEGFLNITCTSQLH